VPLTWSTWSAVDLRFFLFFDVRTKPAMQGSLRLQPILGISRARHMVEFTGLASRVRSFEPSRGGGQRSGLKVVVENVNVYEGQYMRVERVVPDEVRQVAPQQQRRALGRPGWMGGQLGAVTARRRSRAPGTLLLGR
jgi:hypothetical protein